MDLECLDKLVGKKYAKYGIGPDEYDCYGLATKMSELFNLGYPSVEYINSPLADYEIIAKNRSKLIKVNSPRFGDLVTIRLGRYVCHVGVMISEFKFIHSSEPFGVAITSIDSRKYSSRIEGFYRCQKSY